MYLHHVNKVWKFLNQSSECIQLHHLKHQNHHDHLKFHLRFLHHHFHDHHRHHHHHHHYHHHHFLNSIVEIYNRFCCFLFHPLLHGCKIILDGGCGLQSDFLKFLTHSRSAVTALPIATSTCPGWIQFSQLTTTDLKFIPCDF